MNLIMNAQQAHDMVHIIIEKYGYLMFFCETQGEVGKVWKSYQKACKA